MTEQIERELAELFHDRAGRLDVMPPLPVTHVRRARLQTGLALASVLAILAGVGLVGVRLAGADGSDRQVSVTASGQRAMTDLARALRRTLAGRESATTITIGVPSGKFLDAPDLGYSAARTRERGVETRYDGRLGVAVTTGKDGQPETLFVNDTLYTKPDPRYVGRSVPITVAWVAATKGAAQSVSEWRRRSIASAIPGLIWLYQFPPTDVSERDGRITLTTSGLPDMRLVTVVQLGRDGGISTVTSRIVLTSPNAGSDRVDRVVFRTLHGEIADADVPAAATVMSSADYQAAEKADDQSSCPTPPPPSTAPDGTTVTGGVGCLYLKQ